MNGTKLAKTEYPVTTHSKGRQGYKVMKIVVHHMAGDLTLEQCQKVFQNRKSSANYAIDSAGNIGQYVDENDRPWTTSGADPDNYCITIELANDDTKTWHISDNAINRCAELCADICKRYGIKKLYYDGKKGTLLRHCDYSATACPGPYFKSKTDEFCNYVNMLINSQTTEKTNNEYYKVQLGAFKNKDNAEAYAEKLNKNGVPAIVKRG